ncbi:uncharacterized protein MYCGRDRAFT_91122 [Zymoseptoria tritici IPO323]|uniref:Uncharacterized protein n=1 Tax=Zymoseptoria tritici (strain CBS 115943 / IPO323) TaxID=336722 RepID=F9X379_ZYMTI|nr:uncharacterized protein MYCGRDRAFT_91122 [Zymoseptoria tritici IPO323]EGP90305.1 hypothetical protein MYCGRDRAFT_91122 [Zymoseptoria tritici IPO323]
MLTPGSFWEDKGHCILLRDDQTLCNDILLLLQTAAIPDAHLDQYLTQREEWGLYFACAARKGKLGLDEQAPLRGYGGAFFNHAGSMALLVGPVYAPDETEAKHVMGWTGMGFLEIRDEAQ